MSNSVQIDDQGDLRCWNCGSRNLETRRRTGRKLLNGAIGMALVGPVGAAAGMGVKARLRCEGCGQFNETGNPQPWIPPKPKFNPADHAPVRPSVGPRAETIYYHHEPQEPREPVDMRGKFLVAKKPTRGGSTQKPPTA